MNAYIAMLRGINVGGRNSLRMEELRRLCQSLAFRNVRTYAQSGNVVFDSASTEPSALVQRIEEVLLVQHGLAVPVLLRTAGEMRRVVDNNPFANQPDIEERHLYVTFLSSIPHDRASRNSSARDGRGDQFIGNGPQVYLNCPGGYGRTRYNNTYFERAFGVTATTRNWNTVRQLRFMATPGN